MIFLIRGNKNLTSMFESDDVVQQKSNFVSSRMENKTKKLLSN
jgi:hypothetical protein